MELNDGLILVIEKKILVVYIGNYFWCFFDDMFSERKDIYIVYYNLKIKCCRN